MFGERRSNVISRYLRLFCWVIFAVAWYCVLLPFDFLPRIGSIEGQKRRITIAIVLAAIWTLLISGLVLLFLVPSLSASYFALAIALLVIGDCYNRHLAQSEEDGSTDDAQGNEN